MSNITIDRDDLLDALRAETPHEFLADLARTFFPDPLLTMTLVDAQARWPDMIHVGDLEGEIDELEEQKSDLERHVGILQEINNVLRDDVEVLEKKVEDLEADLDKAQAIQTTLRIKQGEMDDRIRHDGVQVQVARHLTGLVSKLEGMIKEAEK